MSEETNGLPTAKPFINLRITPLWPAGAVADDTGCSSQMVCALLQLMLLNIIDELDKSNNQRWLNEPEGQRRSLWCKHQPIQSDSAYCFLQPQMYKELKPRIERASMPRKVK